MAIVRIDRHEQRNALDTQHCELLRDALGEAQAAGARAVVLTGEGSTFCAGADFGEVYGDGFRKALYEMLRRFTSSPVPIIAAVNGPAIGAGTQLALAADLRMVAPGATFAIPTAALGLAVDPWTIRRLALLAGGGNARRILLACEPLPAEEALRCGLADAAGDLDAALERAARLLQAGPEPPPGTRDHRPGARLSVRGGLAQRRRRRGPVCSPGAAPAPFRGAVAPLRRARTGTRGPATQRKSLGSQRGALRGRLRLL